MWVVVGGWVLTSKEKINDQVRFIAILYEQNDSSKFKEELNIPFYYTSLPTAPRSTDKSFYQQKKKHFSYMFVRDTLLSNQIFKYT